MAAYNNLFQEREFKKQAFCDAVAHLANDLGSLDDLPPELADTVANVYYAFWNHHQALAPMRAGKPGPAVASDHPNGIVTGYLELLQSGASILPAYKHAKGFINSVRVAAKDLPDHRARFEYLVQLVLDVLKYNIDKAGTKTPIRRAVERKFKKVHEIAGLYAKMRPLLESCLRDRPAA
jgi:hypothetical protein